MKTKLNEKTFRAVKLMTAGGATMAEIEEYFEISGSTVSRIRASESYEDYCALRSAEYDQRKQQKAEKARKAAEQETPAAAPQTFAAPQPQVVEHRQTVTIQATHYMMQEMKKTNELLELISRKLTFIVDQLN